MKKNVQPNKKASVGTHGVFKLCDRYICGEITGRVKEKQGGYYNWIYCKSHDIMSPESLVKRIGPSQAYTINLIMDMNDTIEKEAIKKFRKDRDVLIKNIINGYTI